MHTSTCVCKKLLQLYLKKSSYKQIINNESNYLFCTASDGFDKYSKFFSVHFETLENSTSTACLNTEFITNIFWTPDIEINLV